MSESGPTRRLPVPTDRRALAFHLLGLAILFGEIAYWLAQPCTTDFLCDPVLGVLLAIGAVPLAVAVALWRFLGLAGTVVVADGLLLAFFVPFTFSFLASGLAGDLAAIPLLLVVFVLVPGVLGPIADLAGSRLQRAITLVALIALAGWTASVSLWFAVAPLLIAAALAIRVRRHGRSEGAVPEAAITR